MPSSGVGFESSPFLVVAGETFHTGSVGVHFPDPTGYGVIVAMGAPWSVYDYDRIGGWVLEEISFLRTAQQSGVPILCICFGGQALAAALGGRVVRSSRPEIGWTTIETDRPELVAAGPWLQWHSVWWILPSGVTAIARTPMAEQAFVAGRSSGLQFHPELTPAILDLWLANDGAAQLREYGGEREQIRAATASQAAAGASRADTLVEQYLERIAGTASPPALHAFEALG